MMMWILLWTQLGAPSQDPPTAKTLEERLKELDEKIGSLEKRRESLEGENRMLEKSLEGARAAREAWVRQNASAWVKRYAAVVELTERQSVELEELWATWGRSDLERSAPRSVWQAREEVVKSKLSPEQIRKLASAVRDEQEAMAKRSIGAFAQMVRLAPDHVAALEKAVLGKVPLSGEALLVQAHPDDQVGWGRILRAVEEGLPGLTGALGSDEEARIRDMLSKWKPQGRRD